MYISAYTTALCISADSEACFLICTGALRAAEDIIIAQLHTTALDTIAVLLKATDRGQRLSPELQAAIQKQLSTMVAERKASAVKAQAQDVLALLHSSSHATADVVMKDNGNL